ncbi:PREDICTED: uncharacterized protein LOC106805146 [Priapulus caudatus]|uniref:Uncharacterized protein LOC106805146 n=1 Tax=Priapulus caudatus TaxID=37621 RepID=A0ABM1DQA4_PRICU|nr:PREDICTED: uncharacterized protein LOC106805146 [Priapulus caudatus]
MVPPALVVAYQVAWFICAEGAAVNRTCQPGELLCRDGSCARVCDSVTDCPDASDEARCDGRQDDDGFDEDLAVNTSIGIGAVIAFIAVVIITIVICRKMQREPAAKDSPTLSPDRANRLGSVSSQRSRSGSNQQHSQTEKLLSADDINSKPTSPTTSSDGITAV